MTEEEMFEKSFERPKNYFHLTSQHQWEIDSRLGILDWEGKNLTEEQKKRFKKESAWVGYLIALLMLGDVKTLMVRCPDLKTQ